MPRLRIATRRSPLALWQANFVADTLRRLHPDLQVEVLPMVTKGDQWLDSPLSRIGGKGLFVKELEHALLANEADIAVHSMKDVPAEFPPGLGLGAILEREDPRDALIGVDSLAALPQNACVGTASQRRQLQVLAQRPDARIRLLRGNINTRLKKLADGQYDAILLAAAGLKRMGFQDRISHILEPEDMLPSIGQGALGIECRLDDEASLARVRPLIHLSTQLRVSAERAMGKCMGGSCQLPIAGYAEIQDGQIWLRGLLGTSDGQRILRDDIRGPAEQAESLGRRLGERMLANGGEEILASVSAL
jgi:hydroxymethylbilane synthase